MPQVIRPRMNSRRCIAGFSPALPFRFMVRQNIWTRMQILPKAQACPGPWLAEMAICSWCGQYPVFGVRLSKPDGWGGRSRNWSGFTDGYKELSKLMMVYVANP